MIIVDIEKKGKNIKITRKSKKELLLRKTIITIEFQEQKMNFLW